MANIVIPVLTTFKLKDHATDKGADGQPFIACKGDVGVVCELLSRRTWYGELYMLTHNGKHIDHARRYMPDDATNIVTTGTLTVEEAAEHRHHYVQSTAGLQIIRGMIRSKRPFSFRFRDDMQAIASHIGEHVIPIDTDSWFTAIKAGHELIVSCLDRQFDISHWHISPLYIDWSTLHYLEHEEALVSHDRVTRNRANNPIQNVLDEIAKSNADRIDDFGSRLQSMLVTISDLKKGYGSSKLTRKHHKQLFKQTIDEVFASEPWVKACNHLEQAEGVWLQLVVQLKDAIENIKLDSE